MYSADCGLADSQTLTENTFTTAAGIAEEL